MRKNIFLCLAQTALCLAALAGCGGGGGAAVQTAGTSVNRGVITAEGNIAVNGYLYDVSGAAITIDGQPATDGDLKAGMVVTVTAAFDNRTSHSLVRKASRVAYATDFSGPVDCVNILNNSLTIMGQQVLVKTSAPNPTVFVNMSGAGVVFANLSTVPHLSNRLSPQFPPNPPDPLNPGITTYSMVKVSGFDNGINGFQATRVELTARGVDLATGFPIGIRGVIGAVDFEGLAFNIGPLTIDYSGYNPVYIPKNLTGGLYVEVNGSSSNYATGNAPTLAPDTFTLISGALPANEGDQAIVSGFVNSLTGSTFRVGLTPVSAQYVSLFGIANAAQVQVTGTWHNGSLLASKISLL